MALLNYSQLNQKAIEVCKSLQEHGFQAYLVGGCVRDLLMEVAPKDWDIATNAKPEQVKSVFTKTYDTGLQHGTITVSLGETVADHFEVTTYRTEGEYSDGRRPDSVAFVDRIEDDLARRDLTINAIAYDPIHDSLVDPYGGQQDIQNKVIKAVGNPVERFQEDGLRIMRTARFAARFDSEVEPFTLAGMKESLETLKKVSKERVRDELCKTLMTTNPNRGLRVLVETGAFRISCPSLTFITNYDDEFQWSGELETRLACLYIHGAEQDLNELKFSGREVKKVALLQELFGRYMRNRQSKPMSEYQYLMSIIKNRSVDDCKSTIKEFVYMGKMLGFPIEEWLEQHENKVVYARNELKLNGDDLLRLGVKPGPKFREILDEAYEKILFHPEMNESQKLLDFARNFKV